MPAIRTGLALLAITLPSHLFSADATLVTQLPHTDNITKIVFSPDGRYFATGAADSTIKIWTPGGLLLRNCIGHSSAITAIAIDARGDTIVSSDAKGGVITWSRDCNTKRRWSIGKAVVQHLAILANSNRVVAAANPTVTLHDFSGAQTGTLKDFNDSVRSLIASPSGDYFVTGSREEVRIWDSHTLTSRRVQVNRYARDIAISSDGATISVTNADNYFFSDGRNSQTGEVTIIDRAGNIQGHFSVNGNSICIDIAPDSSYVVVGREDASVQWYSLTGQKLREAKVFTDSTQFPHPVTDVAINPEDASLVVGLQTSTNQLQRISPDAQSIAGNRAFASSPRPLFAPAKARVSDDLYVEFTTRAMYLRKIGAPIGDPIPGLQTTDGEDFVDAAFHKPSGSILIAYEKKKILIQNFESGARTEVPAFEKQVRRIDTNAKANFFVAAGDDKSIKVFNLDGGKRSSWQVDSNISEISLSPKGDRLALSCQDNSIRIFDLNGKLIARWLAHDGHSIRVAYTPDGKNVVTGSTDNQVIIWSTAGKKIHTLLGHTAYIMDFAFSNDSRMLETHSWDHTRKLWAIANGQLLATRTDGGNPDGTVTVTPDGRFDYTEGGWQMLHWVVGDQIIGLDQFKEQFHKPGLLDELLKNNPTKAKKSGEVSVARKLIGKVFQIKPSGEIVIYTKVSGSLRAGKKLRILNGSSYVDATVTNTLHTNATAKARGAVAVGNPVFE